ncbi:MAG: hypothetical protein KF901_11285, partial [Myxococcales bacterium]|nr:hypothetical protein [Myxococcales bacterium]
ARLLAQQLARRGVRLDSSEGPTRSPLFRPSIVAQKRRLVAEQSFRAGRTHLEGGRFEVAAKAFERARGLEDDPEIELHHLFARWRAGEAALGETLDRKAKEHLRRDPQSAFVPYVIAHRMLDAGDEERALKAFRRAAQLDPTLRDAERHARLLAMRLEK